MQRFARVRGELRRAGMIIGDFDLLIAATALHHKLTVVTRNVRHFQRIPELALYQPDMSTL
jgi:tRNA(fMet)-specific endonuclease VapC